MVKNWKDHLTPIVVGGALLGGGTVEANPNIGPSDVVVKQAKDQESPIKAPITLIEEQGGIAGYSVRKLTIQPSGTWTSESYIADGNGEPKTPVRQMNNGKLDNKQLADIATALVKLQKLPRTLGEPQKVNPHRITLTFGKNELLRIQGVPSRRNASLAEIIAQTSTHGDSEEKAKTTFAEVVGAIEHVRPGQIKAET